MPGLVRVEDFGLRIADGGILKERIAVETTCWDTAAAIGDVLTSVGSKTIWSRPGREDADLRGVTAGIWEGGQLCDAEAERLAAFCAIGIAASAGRGAA